MYTTNNWLKIVEFLEVIALPHYEAFRLLPPGGSVMRCFCMGFFFTVQYARQELDGSEIFEEVDQLSHRLMQFASESHYPDNKRRWDLFSVLARGLLVRTK